MNISYKWLKEYIDLPEDMTPEQVADALTSIGLETGGVERVESIRGGLRGIVIGKVLTCTEHPDSDHLHVTTVDLGGEQPEQIVCGAPNVAAGQTVVVATVGTTLYDGDKEFKIKKSKIRGVESFGMICAEDEIGVGTSHDGIIVLPDGAAAPGTPAAEYFNLSDDYVLEVDLTPNRIDAASHYGVARDLNAWMGVHAAATALRRPSVDAFRAGTKDQPGAIAVAVEAPQACTRYAGVTIRGNRVDLPQGCRLDLGAIAKGYIADRVRDYLVGQGVASAMIDLGGNLYCLGVKPGGEPFRVGIQYPYRDRNEVIAAIDASDVSVVTSGVYERCFEAEGVLYHHILDSATGYPVQNSLLAVTVIAPDSLTADALSTACFALGLERGMALIDSLDGVHALFITDDFALHPSAGLEESCRLELLS